MATEIVSQTDEKNIGEMIASRAERGRELYLTKRQLITKHGEDIYSVPSSDGTRRYIVEYGGKRESCGCTDFAVNRGGFSCKHLTAVALLYAKRRGFTRRTTLACDGCHGRFARRDLTELHDGNHDQLAYFDGEFLCRECARAAGVLY